MAMVSGKVIVILSATLLAAASVTGCSSLVPVGSQASSAGADTAIQTARPQVLAPDDDALLPRQPYDPAGKKIP